MSLDVKRSLFLSIPHSGERVPPEAHWLKDLPEVVLMRDVDRFVDQLYEPAIKKLNLPTVTTCWHRYVVDPNRKKDEFDCQTVTGGPGPGGRHPRGLHWFQTTLGEPLIVKPLAMKLHRQLVKNYYQPFHDSIIKMSRQLKGSCQFPKDLPSTTDEKKTDEKQRSKPESRVFHLDLHSMPSVGTEHHPDPGEKRPEVVISDFHGRSSIPEFKEIVIEAYCQADFRVGYNKPYVGGGITRIYGNPSGGHNTIQVELNRSLYMDEMTKKILPDRAEPLKSKLERAMTTICKNLGLEVPTL